MVDHSDGEGPLNREVKIWVANLEAEAWKYTQTLELRSSETRFEDSFFNQVVALPRAGLFLLANAKKNAIYAIHIDYTPSEILSTATSSSDNVISQGMNARDDKTQDVVINNDAENVEVEVKVVGETGAGLDKATEYPGESHVIEEKKEKAFFSQASGLGIQMARDYSVETYNVEGAQHDDDVGVVCSSDKPAISNDREEQSVSKAAKIGDSEVPGNANLMY